MAEDDYSKRFDEITKLVPDPRKLTSSNGNLHIDYYGELHSGSPAMVKPVAAAKATQADRERIDKLQQDRFERMSYGSFSDNPDFTTAADGLNHTRLMRNWIGGGIMTSCNAFAGHVTKELGLPGLGGFNVENILRTQGKVHCWMTPKSGEKPRHGDLFETRSMNVGYENLHVGFSLKVDGETWWTIEGGQGGPAMGADRICRVKKKYNIAHLLGWVDMRLLLSGKPALPPWLVSSWVIYSDGQTFIYEFDRYGRVEHKAFQARSAIVDAPTLDAGAVTSAFGDKVELKWQSEGGLETLHYDRWNSVGGVNDRLNGTTVAGTAITGVKL